MLKGVKLFVLCKEMNSNTILSDPLSGGLLLTRIAVMTTAMRVKRLSIALRVEQRYLLKHISSCVLSHLDVPSNLV